MSKCGCIVQRGHHEFLTQAMPAVLGPARTKYEMFAGRVKDIASKGGVALSEQAIATEDKTLSDFNQDRIFTPEIGRAQSYLEMTSARASRRQRSRRWYFNAGRLLYR